MCAHIKAHGTLEWYIKVGETSGVAEGFEVESQLLHTCACLIIMLDILSSFHQGDRLRLGYLQRGKRTMF